MADKIIAQYDIETQLFKAKMKSDVIDTYKKSEKAGVDSAQNVSKAYNKAGQSAGGLKGQIGNLKQSFSGLGSGIAQVGAMMGVAFSVEKVIEFGKASVDAFIEAEKGAQLLMFALKGNAGAQERLLDQAAKIQKTTIFGSGEVVAAQTFLANQGRTEAQIRKTIDAAIELSTVTGMDLNSAVRTLDSTYEGSAGSLGKLDRAFKELTPAQLANGAAVDLLIEKYKGTAEAMGETTAGKITRLKNEFGNLQEALGETLLPSVSGLLEGLNALGKGDFGGGVDGLSKAIELGLPFVQEIREAYAAFAKGDFWNGLANVGETVLSLVTLGFYTRVKNYFTPAKDDYMDGLTEMEKAQFRVIAATEKDIQAQREQLKAIGGNVEAFDNWVKKTQDAQITRTFEELSRVLDITKEKYEGLTDISDKYNASARISSDLILDIKNATQQDLDEAFVKFNATLGVTRKDFDDYIGKVQKIKPLQEDLANSTKTMLGPFDQLNKTLGEINKKMLDYLTIGKDATQLDRQRFELQNQINKIQAEYNYLVGLHTPIAKENTEVTKAQSESITVLGQASMGALIPLQQLPFTLQDIMNASKAQIPSIQDMIDSWKDAANLFGALADLGQALNTALTQIFGDAAQKSAVFAAFQKTITVATITFKSFEAIANGIAAFSAGVSSQDPLKIIGGITAIASGIGTLIGGLIQEAQSTVVPAPPSFHEGTSYVQRGNNPIGIDTIPAMLDEGEGVVTRKANAKYAGVVDMMNRGNLDKYILTQWVTPALQAQEKQMQREFADSLASSMLLQSGSNFDDYRMVGVMKEVAMISKYGFKMIDKSIRGTKNPWSC